MKVNIIKWYVENVAEFHRRTSAVCAAKCQLPQTVVVSDDPNYMHLFLGFNLHDMADRLIVAADTDKTMGSGFYGTLIDTKQGSLYLMVDDRKPAFAKLRPASMLLYRNDDHPNLDFVLLRAREKKGDVDESRPLLSYPSSETGSEADIFPIDSGSLLLYPKGSTYTSQRGRERLFSILKS